MYIQDLRPGEACPVKVIYGPGQRAPPTKGRDNLTGPTSPSGSGTVADDFRVYASETVTTRPGSVPEAHRADGHGPRLGLMGIEGANPATIRSAERAMMGWLISEGGRRLVHLMGSSNGIF